MKNKIIAVDFDGTLCENKYPEIGEPNFKVLNHLKKCKEYGDKLILWTCRTGELLDNAISWCKERELEFDAVNENLPEVIEEFGADTRKIFANIYIDDRNWLGFIFDDPDKEKNKYPSFFSLKDWGEKETDIAQVGAMIAEDLEDANWDVKCFETALNAYKLILRNSQSIADISFTAQIANRLLSRKCLSVIEDIDDVWVKMPSPVEGVQVYKCNRLASLVKAVFPNGQVAYNDFNRWTCVNMDDNNIKYNFGFVYELLDSMFPIKFPYDGEHFIVDCDAFAVDYKNGTFDTVAIFNYRNEKKMKVLNLYFKLDGESWVPISLEEFKERVESSFKNRLGGLEDESEAKH